MVCQNYYDTFHLHVLLTPQRGFNFRSKLLAEQGGADNGVLPSSLHILPDRPQVRGMHTMIRLGWLQGRGVAAMG